MSYSPLLCMAAVAVAILPNSSVAIFCIANSIESNNLLMNDDKNPKFIIIFIRYIHTYKQSFLFHILHSTQCVLHTQTHTIEMLLSNCTFHYYSSASPKMIKYLVFFFLSHPFSTIFLCFINSFVFYCFFFVSLFLYFNVYEIKLKIKMA